MLLILWRRQLKDFGGRIFILLAFSKKVFGDLLPNGSVKNPAPTYQIGRQNHKLIVSPASVINVDATRKSWDFWECSGLIFLMHFENDKIRVK